MAGPSYALDQMEGGRTLKKTLLGYGLIEGLTILGHSGGGGFYFKNRTGGFDPKLLSEATSELTAAGSAPQINTILFQSCNVALDPQPLRRFADVFGATEIVGWNHFYVTSLVTVQVKTDTTIDSLRRALRDWLAYLSPDYDLEQIANVPGTHQLLAEWFRVDDSNDPPGPLKTGPGELDARQKNFKPLGSAKERLVQSEAELKELAAELSEWGFQEPAKPLLRIVIQPKMVAAAPLPK